MDKKYKIIFNADSFDRQKMRDNFNFKSKKFNGIINEMSSKVDELDRYDDFENLKISPSLYENNGGDYGIIKTKDHGKNVIYDYQLNASRDFLKELRGFGLLADTVGSGKTFEACVVLSELAERKKIRSLLFIVPKQVISDWIITAEKYFGLGKETLLLVKRDDENEKIIHLDDDKILTENINGYKVPRRPIIISHEDFSLLDSSITTYLFDCIVIDEAHHLCSEKKTYTEMLYRVSKMIRIKKKAQRPYCLLLSATPHSGNLENMFKLWYFIRCTGGNPEDFINDNKSDEYNEEKRYYLDKVLRKAKTVMQFIEIVKRSEVENKYKDEYFSFINKKFNDQTEYEELPIGKKNEMIQAFLNQVENKKIYENVTKTIASAYHNGVLRSIMIRNPKSIKDSSKRRHIDKKIINYLFFETNKDIPSSIEILDDSSTNKGIIVNINKLNSEEAIKYEGKNYSLKKYVLERAGDYKYSIFYANLIREILSNIDDVDSDNSDSCIFEKKHSFRYYQQRLKDCESRIDNRFIIEKYNKNDLFTDKYNVTLDILSKHMNERVIIFFDYDAKRNKDDDENRNVIKRFIKSIESSTYKDRVIIGYVKSEKDKMEVEEAFNQKENAVLICASESLTEGTNLQKSSIIINFEISPNPVALDQRIGRVFRLGQKQDVTIYSLAHMHILEGYSLMYFSSIGLLTSNSGDATIIAGSNSENMVAVRCTCGNVKLLSEDDYEFLKSRDLLYCDDPTCMRTRPKERRLMTEISIENYKCDCCGEALVRSNVDDLYRCLSTPGYSNTSRNMTTSNGGKIFTCQKICAMGNCEMFRKWEKDGFTCPVLGAYHENKYISPVSLILICAKCERYDICPKDCHYETDSESINKCSICPNATCIPKPHAIIFNAKHEAKCPSCKDGYLKPALAQTFGQYIRKAWDFKNDNGASFCDNLEKEAEKVREIKKVLDSDGSEEDY